MEVFHSDHDQDHDLKVNSSTILHPPKHHHRPKRVLFHQIRAFLLTASLYSFVHALRTTWGYCKPYLGDSNPYYSNLRLGGLDLAFMISYAIGQFGNGWLGDRVNLKISLSVGTVSAVLAICLFGVFEGFLNLSNIFLDVVTFVVNGLGQSAVDILCFWTLSNCSRDIPSVFRL